MSTKKELMYIIDEDNTAETYSSNNQLGIFNSALFLDDYPDESNEGKTPITEFTPESNKKKENQINEGLEKKSFSPSYEKCIPLELLNTLNKNLENSEEKEKLKEKLEDKFNKESTSSQEVKDNIFDFSKISCNFINSKKSKSNTNLADKFYDNFISGSKKKNENEKIKELIYQEDSIDGYEYQLKQLNIFNKKIEKKNKYKNYEFSKTNYNKNKNEHTFYHYKYLPLSYNGGYSYYYNNNYSNNLINNHNKEYNNKYGEYNKYYYNINYVNEVLGITKKKKNIKTVESEEHNWLCEKCFFLNEKSQNICQKCQNLKNPFTKEHT